MSHIPCPVCQGFKMITDDGVRKQCPQCVGEGAVNQKTGRPDSWVEPEVEPEEPVAEEPVAAVAPELEPEPVAVEAPAPPSADLAPAA